MKSTTSPKSVLLDDLHLSTAAVGANRQFGGPPLKTSSPRGDKRSVLEARRVESASARKAVRAARIQAANAAAALSAAAAATAASVASAKAAAEAASIRLNAEVASLVSGAAFKEMLSASSESVGGKVEAGRAASVSASSRGALPNVASADDADGWDEDEDEGEQALIRSRRAAAEEHSRFLSWNLFSSRDAPFYKKGRGGGDAGEDAAAAATYASASAVFASGFSTILGNASLLSRLVRLSDSMLATISAAGHHSSSMAAATPQATSAVLALPLAFFASLSPLVAAAAMAGRGRRRGESLLIQILWQFLVQKIAIERGEGPSASSSSTSITAISASSALLAKELSPLDSSSVVVSPSSLEGTDSLKPASDYQYRVLADLCAASLWSKDFSNNTLSYHPSPLPVLSAASREEDSLHSSDDVSAATAAGGGSGGSGGGADAAASVQKNHLPSTAPKRGLPLNLWKVQSAPKPSIRMGSPLRGWLGDSTGRDAAAVSAGGNFGGIDSIRNEGNMSGSVFTDTRHSLSSSEFGLTPLESAVALVNGFRCYPIASTLFAPLDAASFVGGGGGDGEGRGRERGDSHSRSDEAVFFSTSAPPPSSSAALGKSGSKRAAMTNSSLSFLPPPSQWPPPPLSLTSVAGATAAAGEAPRSRCGTDLSAAVTGLETDSESSSVRIHSEEEEEGGAAAAEKSKRGGVGGALAKGKVVGSSSPKKKPVFSSSDSSLSDDSSSDGGNEEGVGSKGSKKSGSRKRHQRMTSDASKKMMTVSETLRRGGFLASGNGRRSHSLSDSVTGSLVAPDILRILDDVDSPRGSVDGTGTAAGPRSALSPPYKAASLHRMTPAIDVADREPSAAYPAMQQHHHHQQLQQSQSRSILPPPPPIPTQQRRIHIPSQVKRFIMTAQTRSTASQPSSSFSSSSSSLAAAAAGPHPSSFQVTSSSAREAGYGNSVGSGQRAEVTEVSLGGAISGMDGFPSYSIGMKHRHPETAPHEWWRPLPPPPRRGASP